MTKEGPSAAFVTNGLLSQENYLGLFKKAKEKGFNRICCFCYGQSYIDGYPALISKEEREQTLFSCGADEVFFLPSKLDMLDEGSLAFSLAETLSKRWDEKERRIEALLLPVDGDASMFDHLFLFLASLPRTYVEENQKRCFAKRNALGHNSELLERYLPGSKTFLEKEENIISFRYYQTARSIYCPVELKAFPFPLDAMHNSLITKENDKRLYDQLKEKVTSFGAEAKERLNNIYLGSETISKDLLLLLKEKEGEFSKVAKALEKDFTSLIEARRYLLRVIEEYRKIDETVACLKGFVEE